jgi:hypothetical protein
MPHSTLDKRREWQKKNWDKHKDEINRKRREKYACDEEYRKKRAEADKRYYDKVKKNPEWQKENYFKNKDRDKEYKKRYIIGRWIANRKRNGVKFIGDPVNTYNLWINTTTCNFCNKTFESEIDKCVEHHHSSGYIRGICCRKCNGNLASVDMKLKDNLLELHRYFLRL